MKSNVWFSCNICFYVSVSVLCENTNNAPVPETATEKNYYFQFSVRFSVRGFTSYIFVEKYPIFILYSLKTLYGFHINFYLKICVGSLKP